MAQLGMNKNIEILTRSSVLDVQQDNRDFLLRVRSNPRFVIPEKCIGCGLCEDVCPENITSLSHKYDKLKKAIYLPSPTAIPRGYVIDAKSCAFFTNRACGKCAKICPRHAIDLNQAPQEFEVRVAAVILSPGATLFDPRALPSFGYNNLKNVVTTLEMESLLSPATPDLEGLKRLASNSRTPAKIAWIQCVGSRQTNVVDRPFCSSICCMASIKQALSLRQMLVPEPEVSIFYIDVRAHQKGAERYLRLAVKAGVRLIPSRIHFLEEVQGEKIRITAWTDSGKRLREIYDMVVLSCGLGSPEELGRLSTLFGVETSRYGFSKGQGLITTMTSKPGIYASGTYTDPKSIQGAVIEGSAAAAFLCSDLKISSFKDPGAMELDLPNGPAPSLEPPRIGVFICECGKNIGQVVDVNSLVQRAKKINGVVVAKHLKFACAPDSLDLLSATIIQKGLNRIVIGACSPKSHEPLFKKALRDAGLNDNLLEIANIREQAAWVHAADPDGATKRALDQIVMSIAKAGLLKALELPQYPVTKHALVIGGGISGLTAAKLLSDRGIKVSLLEKKEILGGNGRSLLRSWKGVEIRKYVDGLIGEVTSKRNVEVFLRAQLLDVQGETGNLTSFVRYGSQGQVKAINHGAVIVASGAQEAKPLQFHYGDHPRILTHQELDQKIIKSGFQIFQQADSVVFIQCVGSCSQERPYCSRVCCTHSVNRAILLKKKRPELSIYILYRHMRTYGQREDLYTEARSLGIKTIRFTEDTPPEVELLTAMDEDKRPETIISVTIFDSLTGRVIKIKPDYLVLASAIEPDINGNQRLSKILKVPLDQDGFFQEAHNKLRPVELRRDGFFVAGLAHYPKEVEESISQAAAAASKAAVFLSKERVTPDRITAEVLISRCDGCALCLDVCDERAIKLVEYIHLEQVKKIVEIDTSLCSGCGACTASCPQFAIGIPGFMPEQILAQIKVIA